MNPDARVAPEIATRRGNGWPAWRSDLLCLAAVFVPVLTLAAWKAFMRPRPFYAQFFDPETFYFHDGLRLLGGHAPLDVTHPGTPVQVLSAVIALATGATGATPEQVDGFRAAAYCVGWLLQVLGATLLLRTVLSGTPFALRAAALLTYFVAAKSLDYETVWSPELLYFPAGALVLAALWRALSCELDTWSCLLFGAAIGVACAVKFLFLSWFAAGAVVALAAGRTWFHRLRSLGVILLGAAGGFGLATLAAAARYSDMLSWVRHLATHSGRYGESPVAIPSTATLAGNLLDLVAGAKGWYCWLLLLFFGAAAALRAARGGAAPRVPALALFCAAAIALGHALVLRGPSPHYLLPAAVATVGLAAAAANWPALRRATLAPWLGLAVVAALFAKHGFADLRTHLARVAMVESGRSDLSASLARHGRGRGPVVVYGYGVPMPSLALRYFATDPSLLRRVEELYPGEGHVGPGGGLVLPAGARRWDMMVLDPRVPDSRAMASGLREVDRVGQWRVLVPAAASDARGAP